MAAVLTTSMTLRIILNIRSSLDHGGSFALSGSSAHNSSRSGGAGGAIHGLSNISGGVGAGTHPAHSVGLASVQLRSTHAPVPPNTYTIDELRTKGESGWDGDVQEDKSSVGAESKRGPLKEDDEGVKVTIDREVLQHGYGKK